jgi:putative heme iron utilization protein
LQILSSPQSVLEQVNKAAYIRPSVVDKARTITQVCTSGTLCTTSIANGVQGFPFGSYVDYVADEQGCPILLLNEKSPHTQNILRNSKVSLFCQQPRLHLSQVAAAVSRVTLMGTIEEVPRVELAALQMAFTLIHQHSEQNIDSPHFKLYRIQPEKVYFSGGFNVLSSWVDAGEYRKAAADIVAPEVPAVLARVNADKQGELLLLCKHFLGLQNVDLVRIQSIDKLGIDLRVKTDGQTDEYRVGFRHDVSSAEDAKSEMVKLFQEAWEREQGYFFASDLPPFAKYAADVMFTGVGTSPALR